MNTFASSIYFYLDITMLSVSGENHIQFTWIQHIIFTLMVPIYRTADRNVPTHILYSVRYVLWDIHCTLILTPGNNLVLTVIWMICVKVSFSFTWDFQLVHFGYVWIPAQHNTGQVFFSVLRGHSVVFILTTTANDLRLRGISIPDLMYYIIFLS